MVNNPYLTMAEKELEEAIESMKNLKITLYDILSDLPHIEGTNGEYPRPLIINAINNVEESIRQTAMVNDFVKEMIANG